MTARLGEILETIRATIETFGHSQAELFSSDPPVIRAITSLAEGADRLFARAALDVGLALCCPFPFRQAEFERDFVAPASRRPGSLDEFRALLERAAHESGLACVEMDGDPAQRATAYTACSEVVVHQSDVLCVVWDGERRQLPGGTEYALDYAMAMDVPVVWVDARAPHHWRVVCGPADVAGSPARPTAAGALSEVRELVLRALRTP